MSDVENKIKEKLEEKGLSFLKMDEKGVVYVQPRIGRKIVDCIINAENLAADVPEITAVVVNANDDGFVVTGKMSEKEEKENEMPFYIMNAYQELGVDGMMEIFSNPTAIALLRVYQDSSLSEKTQLEGEMTKYLSSLVREMKAAAVKSGKSRLKKAIAEKKKEDELTSQPE